jgi:Malectin domain/Glycosyl hydrolase family 30 beta sandwich domain
MSWAAGDENTFIKNDLSPALASAGLSPKILGYDHNWDNTSYASTLLGDPTTRSDLAGIAWHCYAGSPSAMTSIYDSAPIADAYETECSTETSEAPINLLMQSVQNYARTVELWNIALDPNKGPHTGGCADCNRVVTITESTGNVTYSNDSYQLGQFSKFVAPGAYHIASNTLGSLADVAFKNTDGSKVVVAHNDGSSSSTFQVVWSNQGITYTLPAGATVTFTWSSTQQTTIANGGYAISAGGSGSGSFQADNYSLGGNSNTATVTDAITTSGVSNPAPQAVYQGQRYGNFSYVFSPLQAGASYTVRLHFAETYWSNAGQRVFNASLNSSRVLTNFDIIAATGAKDQAIVEQFTTTADSSGQITIQFSTVVDNAMVDGIEIIPVGGTPTGLSINCGGGATGSYVADEDFSGGSTASTTASIDTSSISNPTSVAVYQTERYGNFTYAISGLAPNVRLAALWLKISTLSGQKRLLCCSPARTPLRRYYSSSSSSSSISGPLL